MELHQGETAYEDALAAVFNGDAAGYGDVILLRRLLLAEGDHLLAADLLLMALDRPSEQTCR
ncbi:hypothetical protein CWE17_01205 [Synechococcus sp. BS56D]|uniref:hypothetical protein n=1 Tax=Synechococcus sp. BS56D TaxID=2055944 RepID=UPI00103C9694|nr:hypothetical protein [Synechococcus sp. BS56D]TCD59432.1 hypothetical protein CWE17_01205 [Synechococcus sp. BS56D]